MLAVEPFNFHSTPPAAGGAAQTSDGSMPASNTEGDERSHRFAVVSEPVTDFYKDEGGKGNMCHATISLEELPLTNRSHRGKRSLPPLARLPIKLALHYESGIRVEDEAEIFRVHSIEPAVFTPNARTFDVAFRIEKVSRRKDGQRFKVRFEVDEKLNPEAAAQIEGVFCHPITVLSKRKFPPSSSHHGTATKRSTRRRKTRSRNSSFDCVDYHVGAANNERMLQRLQEAEDAIDELMQKLQAQSARIAQLEANAHQNSGGSLPSGSPRAAFLTSAAAAAAGGGSGKVLAEMRYYSPLPKLMADDSLEMPVCDQTVSAGASPIPAGGGGGDGANPPVGSMLVGAIVEGGTLKPPAFRRLRSADLTFNFGPPSPLSFKDIDQTM